MSEQLPDESWDSLGDHGVFLKALSNSQAQQLQIQNQELQNHFVNSQNNLVQAASNAAVAAAQQIAPPNQSPSKPTIKAADPEKFSGDRAETEGFIRALNLSIASQPRSFPDARTKMLYALSCLVALHIFGPKMRQTQ